jgi:hypothetical protein
MVKRRSVAISVKCTSADPLDSSSSFSILESCAARHTGVGLGTGFRGTGRRRRLGSIPAGSPVGPARVSLTACFTKRSGVNLEGGRFVPLLRCGFLKGGNHERHRARARPARGRGPVQRRGGCACHRWRRGFNRAPVRHRAAATVRASPAVTKNPSAEFFSEILTRPRGTHP